MRISHQFKFIFFSNPKTGSESIRELLKPYSDVEIVPYNRRTNETPFYPHISPKETKEHFDTFGWHYDSYFKFVFVRNPWSRLVSLYEMILDEPILTRKIKRLTTANINRRLNQFFKPSFTKWLYSTKTDGLGGGGRKNQRWRKYGTYTLDNYITDDSGNILVNKVIKLEEIGSQLMPVLKTLNIPDIENLGIPFVNKRPKKADYHLYYTPETIALVQERYQYELREFGYSFDDWISSV